MIKAVIDVGSNSVLLTVAEGEPRAWRTLLETSEVTGLGRGTLTSGRLSEQGIADTLRAVDVAFIRARDAGATEIVAAATMAARMAGNASQFLARAEAQGTPITILSGEQEADLGFRAVADDPTFSGSTRIGIIDPGGHSTELQTATRKGDRWETTFRRSYAIGALGLREGALNEEAPSPASRLAALAQIDELIGLRYRPNEGGVAVCLGATGVNLVTMREGMVEWQPDRVHGATLGYEEVSKAVDRLCSLDDRGRAALPGLERGRERTIHAGALILERFMFALGVESCRVSVRGWRHALLDEMGVSPPPKSPAY